MERKFLDLYVKKILPYKQRAEKAEALCELQSELINKLATKVMSGDLDCHAPEVIDHRLA